MSILSTIQHKESNFKELLGVPILPHVPPELPEWSG